MRAHLKRPAYIELVGVLTRVLHEVVYGLERNRSRHDEAVRIDLRARDHLQIVGLEVRTRLAEQRCQRQRVRGNQITVRGRFQQLVDHDDAVGAGTVLDDDVLPEFAGQQPRHHAREQIDRRTGLRPAQESDRTRRIFLRNGRERQRCKGKQCTGDSAKLRAGIE